MMVGTEQGRWVVPPDRAVWIPGGMRHDLRMMSAVTTVTFWVEPDARSHLPRASVRSSRCRALMRSLLTAAIDVEPEYDRDGRAGLIMSLLLHELKLLPALAARPEISARIRGWSERCHAFLPARPHDTIEVWSDALGMSRRTFTRLFRKETGLSFAAWRQQACLFAALPRLAAHEPITQIALDLGYESPAAFTTMFKRLQGVPPSHYFSGAVTIGNGGLPGDIDARACRGLRGPLAKEIDPSRKRARPRTANVASAKRSAIAVAMRG